MVLRENEGQPSGDQIKEYNPGGKMSFLIISFGEKLTSA